MLPGFVFRGFEPDEALRAEADLALDHLLELAPEGTIAVAALARGGDGGGYLCAVDLYSRNGQLIGRATQPTPEQAVQHVRAILREKLLRLRIARTRLEQVPIVRAALTG